MCGDVRYPLRLEAAPEFEACMPGASRVHDGDGFGDGVGVDDDAGVEYRNLNRHTALDEAHKGRHQQATTANTTAASKSTRQGGGSFGSFVGSFGSLGSFGSFGSFGLLGKRREKRRNRIGSDGGSELQLSMVLIEERMGSTVAKVSKNQPSIVSRQRLIVQNQSPIISRK